MNKYIEAYKEANSYLLNKFNIENIGPFNIFNVPYFPIPMLSCATLYTNKLTRINLEELEKIVKSETKLDTVSLKVITKSPSIKVSHLLKNMNYEVNAEYNVNLWNRIINAPLPPGFSIQVGSFFDKSIYRNFDFIQKTVFKVDDPFQAKVRKLTRDMNQKTFVINILNKQGKPVAAGGVTVYKNIGWLFGGAVLPRYQGKGLWPVLLSTRQYISSQIGANLWFLETQNPKIKNYYDHQFSYHLYTKKIK